MRGRLRSVRASAITTNTKVETVPNHPQPFPIQSPYAKRRVANPKKTVYKLYVQSVMEIERSQNPKKKWMTPMRDCTETRIATPMRLPAIKGRDRLAPIALHTFFSLFKIFLQWFPVKVNPALF
jgi:hypothetical protein